MNQWVFWRCWIPVTICGWNHSDNNGCLAWGNISKCRIILRMPKEELQCINWKEKNPCGGTTWCSCSTLKRRILLGKNSRGISKINTWIKYIMTEIWKIYFNSRWETLPLMNMNEGSWSCRNMFPSSTMRLSKFKGVWVGYHLPLGKIFNMMTLILWKKL